MHPFKSFALAGSRHSLTGHTADKDALTPLVSQTSGVVLIVIIT